MSDLFPRDLDVRHFARVIESSDDAIISKDLNGTILSWNQAATRLFGYPAADVIGRSIRLIIPGDRQPEEDALLARLRAGETITDWETVRQHRDGTLVPISLTLSPILDESGRIVGASSIARDIAQRKAGERAMRQLAAIVESSDDAIVTKDLDSRITSWNHAAERMFGYTAEEVIGRSIRLIIPAERQHEEEMVMSRIRAGEKLEHFETRRRRKDGTELDISLTVSPLRDAHGQIVGASKIARDVTERVRLLEAAREQARTAREIGGAGARIAASLDTATIVQQVTDLATILTSAAFGAFFYLVDDPVSGKACMHHALSGAPGDLFADLPDPRDVPIFASTFEGPGPMRLDDVTREARFAGEPPFARQPPLDGTGMAADHPPVRSYLAVPVKAATGPVVGGLFFGHPVAGRFTEQHEQLVTGIAAWAALALENARSYVIAREADRLKDEFLAVLSHELRTPLNAILGYARLLRGGVLTGDKSIRALETVERNATALTQMVEDVLDVSRIVAGKIRLDVQRVELPLIIHDAVATVQPAADAKQIRLQTIVDPRVDAVSGDPDRLQQVVWNLLANAVKFTPKGGRVHIQLSRVNSHVELVVSDTGVGIRPDFLPHVFDRFRQGESGTMRVPGGLGLGLSIVKHMVEMHGGTVHAHSDGEGRGATFHVRLPMMIVDSKTWDPTREHPRTSRPPLLTALGGLDGLRVLAIDDDADALALLRSVLEGAGAEVVGVASARAALQQLPDVQPHVLVVDLGMPGMDGFAFIQEVRRASDPRMRDVPAAALTAFARSEDRTKTLQAGFEMHLAKPVDPGELVAAVAMLARRGRRAS